MISALAADALRAIAEASGGSFVDAATPGAAVQLYERAILPLASEPVAGGADGEGERESRFQFPLARAVLLWILERGFRERRIA